MLWLAIVFALALAYLPSADAKKAKPLLAGSLNWEIDRAFTTGNRTVKFTLKTAFELDRSCQWRANFCTGGTMGTGAPCSTVEQANACRSGGGSCEKMISCTVDADVLQYGVLCVDQYSTTTLPGGVANLQLSPVSTYQTGVCKYDAGSGTGTRNQFVVEDVRRINGVEVLFGRKEHTVTVHQDTVAIIAYFANNVADFIVGAKRGVLGGSQGVLMPQCSAATLPVTPCAVNINDPSAAPTFGLFKESTGLPKVRTAQNGIESSVARSVYWGESAAFTATWPSADTSGVTSLFELSPSLETMVQLCSISVTKWGCSGVNGTETISNYHSPVAAFPPFPQFAVTTLTQTGGASHPVTKYNWFKNGVSGPLYKAPHPPVAFKSYDYDGHMMTVFDYNSANSPSASNMRAECFNGEANGVWNVNPGKSEWPFFEGRVFRYGEKKCKLFFGDNRVESGNQARGNLIKLDFDFGGTNGTVSEFSAVYKSKWYRCGSNNAACSALGDSCVTATGQPAPLHTCSGSRMFSQHVLNTLDLPFVDVDKAASQNFEEQIPMYFTTAGNPRSALSQTIFSAYGCWAGTKNQPPRFVKDLDEAPGDCQYVRHTNNDTLVETEYRCKAGDECIIPLHARDFHLDDLATSSPDLEGCKASKFTRAFCDLQMMNGGSIGPVGNLPGPVDALFQSCDVVQIYQTPGWDWAKASLVRASCSLNPQKACVRDADCGAMDGTCTGADGIKSDVCEGSADEFGSVKCFHKERFETGDAGKYFVRCFSTRDPQGDLKWKVPEGDDPRLSADEGLCNIPSKPCYKEGFNSTADKYPPNMFFGDRYTCSSPPMCIRIFVESSAPVFVSPTPLEANSYDDDGVLVEGRTDIGACEGYPLQLTIAATDGDAADKVRIFLEDRDVGVDNVDFFANLSSVSVPPACSGALPGGSAVPKWKGFTGYMASKVGDNAQETSIFALSGVKSIASPYASKVEYVAKPKLGVAYTLDPRLRNGITVRNSDPSVSVDPSGQNCLLSYVNGSKLGGSCRQKLVNMDQIVCAYAYDNSHAIYGRWMGVRNPNSVAGTNDHSNGDLASRKHCWRIRLQSPPVFVTGPDKLESPFSDEWSLSAEDGTFITGKEASYPRIPVTVGQRVERTFYVADPNPEDSVRLFVLGEPTPPRGLKLGRTECLGVEGMCGATDRRGGYANLVQTKVSSCSRAKATLSWVPGVEHAGKNVRVCLQARDSSTLCDQKGPPDATAMGWYGEIMCVDFVVGDPVVAWHGSSDVMSSGTAQQNGYVGCAVRITAVAYDATLGSEVEVSLVGDLPSADATFESRPSSLGLGVVTWVPRRGMEGSRFTVCFSARDRMGVLPALPTACRTIEVQRCQYCIKGGDTLGSVMKKYGLDTNWLRLWLHNGNSNPAGSELPIMVDNPDLIVQRELSTLSEDERRENSLGQPVVWVGPVYDTRMGETLALLASKFRTTVSSILSVNPDIKGEDDVVEGTSLCLIPCSQARQGWA